jgi:5-hydroxyisourate hydrolase-like protein (transthyretin family)
MRASLNRAIGATAVAAAMAAATLSVAGAASAATHRQAKTPTTLSITEAATTINPGQTDVISGRLLTGPKPVVGKTVYLYDYDSAAKKWEPLAVDLTGSAGRVKFTVAPAATTAYELQFHGSPTLAASRSGGATVLVTRPSTTLSAAEATAVIAPGQSDVITGTLLTAAAPVADVAVRIYRYNSAEHAWVLHDVADTNSSGQVAFTVTPGATDYYQLFFEGNAAEAPSHSGVVTVLVTKLPTTLSVAEATTSITAGHHDVITGDLLTGPTPVAAKVVFLYRWSGSAKRWEALAVDLTNSSGEVTFTVGPKTTTSYKLEFHGTSSLYSSDSGDAVVTVID